MNLTISYKELKKEGLMDEMGGPTFELADIPKIFLKLRRQEVVCAYAALSGLSAQEIEHTYECGIDNWIGFGSVTCYELGGWTLVGFGYQEIQIRIG